MILHIHRESRIRHRIITLAGEKLRQDSVLQREVKFVRRQIILPRPVIGDRRSQHRVTDIAKLDLGILLLTVHCSVHPPTEPSVRLVEIAGKHTHAARLDHA